ncbi:uncharacterized protein [Spinacia oleracea]|uniref:Uncharacterized protein isoform X2 n=1 Tax=Spinacia oleracea TaxID=3562 RepID=A0ABM3RAG4_SPIOL|nr:uncharacterized protein LOC130467794 isoform X2 [Spinacia oleracea]
MMLELCTLMADSRSLKQASHYNGGTVLPRMDRVASANDFKGIITRYYSATEFSSMRQYSVKAVYQKMTPGQHRVPWDNIIWCRLAVPKHKIYQLVKCAEQAEN